MAHLVHVCDGCGEPTDVGEDVSSWKKLTFQEDDEYIEPYTKQFCPNCVDKVNKAVPGFFVNND